MLIIGYTVSILAYAALFVGFGVIGYEVGKMTYQIVNKMVRK